MAKARENPARRQAFSDQQVASLLATAPEPGRSIYRAALLTGLRRGELQELRWGDLHLDAARPFIQLQGQHTKNRKADVLPLHGDLVAMFKAAMPNHPQAKVFPAIPGMKRFRTDLKRAGIPPADFDFHCLRHTYCTMVVKSGCTMKEAQQLMRHSSIELTSKVYTHLGMTDIAGALDKVHIPMDTGNESLRATGTSDALAFPPAESRHRDSGGRLDGSQPPLADERLKSSLMASRDKPVLPANQSAHQMAHQTTCLSGHDEVQAYTTTIDPVKTSEVQETIANTSGFAIMHDDAQTPCGRSSMAERQPSKLAVEGSSPFARFYRSNRGMAIKINRTMEGSCLPRASHRLDRGLS